MSVLFAETLKELRAERELSQQELARQMLVTQPTIARWENGSCLPDTTMISRLSRCLDVGIGTLMGVAAACDESPTVVMVDNGKAALSEGLNVLEKAIPNAIAVGFAQPIEAIEYAKANRVALAFLDIELEEMDGFELCRSLLDINPRTNVVYLTAGVERAFDALCTGACGFLLKPITPESVRTQLESLLYPLPPASG